MPESNVPNRGDLESYRSELVELKSLLVMLEHKVDNAARATEQGFEFLNKLLAQQFAQADQKLEHTSREMRQSIEFLTDQLRTTKTEQAAVVTKVSALETDVKRLGDRYESIHEHVTKLDTEKAVASDVAEVKENIQWHYRRFAGALIGVTVLGVVAMLQFVN